MADTTLGDTSKLNAAIGQVSRDVLVGLSIRLCKTNPAARAFFDSHLFVNEDDVPIPSSPRSSASSEASEDASDDEKEPAPKPTTAGPKRSRTRYAYCMNCEKEFDTLENTRKSCSYHPGMHNTTQELCSSCHPYYPSSKYQLIICPAFTIPDEEFFVDHYENCHGIIDSAEMREEFPEGFIYECCDRNGEEEPCTTDWHREREEPTKRQRSNY